MLALSRSVPPAKLQSSRGYSTRGTPGSDNFRQLFDLFLSSGPLLTLFDIVDGVEARAARYGAARENRRGAAKERKGAVAVEVARGFELLEVARVRAGAGAGVDGVGVVGGVVDAEVERLP